MGDETLKQPDVNVFFRNKQNQNEDVFKWSDKAIAKLKQTYQKYMLEAGVVENIEENAVTKKICRPYIEQEFREELLSNGLDKYLYSLTGELYDAVAKLFKLTNDDNLIVTHILNNTPEEYVVFLTGIGNAFPFVRSHNVLNNLHQVRDRILVVMFYPGRWNGQSLELFGTICQKNCYIFRTGMQMRRSWLLCQNIS